MNELKYTDVHVCAIIKYMYVSAVCYMYGSWVTVTAHYCSYCTHYTRAIYAAATSKATIIFYRS